MIDLRKASHDDCRDLYDWRNHPLARKSSLDQGEIRYEDHVKWFEESMKNPARTIYVAIESREKVGQIRFDRESCDVARVSVTVNPSQYGKGYGSRIIFEGSKKYFSEEGVDKIRAEIRPENIASVRAFEKAGYKFLERKGEILEYVVKNGEI